MYVSKMELRNFRSYKKQEINFSNGINLIIGPNNSGKTTILKALYNLQDRLSMQPSDIRKTEEYCKVKIELEEISEIERKLFYNYKIENTHMAAGNRQTVLLGLAKAPETYVQDNLCFDSNLNAVINEANGKIRLLNNENREMPFNTFPKFPNSEAENNFIYPFFAKRKVNHFASRTGNESSYLVNDDLSNLAAKVQKIGAAAHPRFKNFQKHCNDILGFEISTIASDNNDDGQKVGTFATDKHKIFLEAMGEGVANIVGLITILLTENNKLFLIEELENDIHPQALKKLLKLIEDKSRNNQFIISTHSNIVVKQLGCNPKTKLFYTRWENTENVNDEAKKIPTSTVTEEENTPENRIQILESLGYDLFDFDLYSSYLIFEESSAEKVVRNIILPFFFPELHPKIRTIAAKGADDLGPKFNDFHRLFVFVHSNPVYNKRAWVLADGDEAGRRNIEKLQEDFRSWPPEHFINFSKDNFEEYYPQRYEKRVKEIFRIGDNREKWEKKKELNREVVAWASKNRAEAMEEFAVSAKEIINVLGAINASLNNR